MAATNIKSAFGKGVQAAAVLALAVGLTGVAVIDAEAGPRLRAGVTASDSAGNRGAARGGCAAGAYGGGCAGGYTARGADGTVTHRSGFAASGRHGSGYSSGGFTRDADGSISGGRDTAITTSKGSYRGSTTYGDGSAQRSATWSNENGSAEVNSSWSKEDGYSRDVTCRDASGAVVDCP